MTIEHCHPEGSAAKSKDPDDTLRLGNGIPRLRSE